MNGYEVSPREHLRHQQVIDRKPGLFRSYGDALLVAAIGLLTGAMGLWLVWGK